MRILAAVEGGNRGRSAPRLVLLLLLSLLISCSTWSPKKKSREDRLREDLRSFHWALIAEDAPNALRYVPSDERDTWDESFSCLFRRLRLLDFRVELTKFGEGAKEASVRVRWTGHSPNSLVVEEIVWKEEWTFNSKKDRWSLLPSPGELKGLPEECLPLEPPDEGPPESLWKSPSSRLTGRGPTGFPLRSNSPSRLSCGNRNGPYLRA